MIKYRVFAEVTLYIDACITGKDMTDAADLFKMRIQAGNYDRQLNRKLASRSKNDRHIEINNIQMLWKK